MSNSMTNGTFTSAQDPNSSTPRAVKSTQAEYLDSLERAIRLAPQADRKFQVIVLEDLANRVREEMGIPTAHIFPLEITLANMQDRASRSDPAISRIYQEFVKQTRKDLD